MRAKSLPCFFVFLFSIDAIAQPQVVNFKDLQQLLPQGDFQNFVCGKPTGETSTMMGFSTSWAQVIYRAATDSINGTVSVKITDMLNIPSYMSIAPTLNAKLDRETGTGYEKTVMYKDAKVLETYDSASHQAKLQLSLANRFLIEISGEDVRDPEALYAFLDKTDLDGLRKIVQPAGPTKK